MWSAPTAWKRKAKRRQGPCVRVDGGFAPRAVQGPCLACDIKLPQRLPNVAAGGGILKRKLGVLRVFHTASNGSRTEKGGQNLQRQITGGVKCAWPRYTL